jgi:hypothetical protein|nr:hypothetical protein [Actinomycetota bacterium]
MVDSGAYRSFFPKSIAAGLGLENSLVQDAQGARGVEDQEFPTWSSTEQIVARIVRNDPQTQAEELWGPEIPMNPAFAEKPTFLLGREDFFAPFVITFDAGFFSVGY